MRVSEKKNKILLKYFQKFSLLFRKFRAKKKNLNIQPEYKSFNALIVYKHHKP